MANPGSRKRFAINMVCMCLLEFYKLIFRDSGTAFYYILSENITSHTQNTVRDQQSFPQAVNQVFSDAIYTKWLSEQLSEQLTVRLSERWSCKQLHRWNRMCNCRTNYANSASVLNAALPWHVGQPACTPAKCGKQLVDFLSFFFVGRPWKQRLVC